ncbi:unnamed protein product [Prunus armeniaca]
MGPEFEDLSHVQQGWSHWADMEVESVAGRILEAQSNSQKKKLVDSICPLYHVVPHFTRGIGATQILTNLGMRSQGKKALKAQRSFNVTLKQKCHFLKNMVEPMRTQNKGVLEQMEDILVQILLGKWMKLASNLYCMIINAISSEIAGDREKEEPLGRVFGEDIFEFKRIGKG